MPIRRATSRNTYFTVPSAYLDIALRAERSRAEGLLLTAELWGQERGAITQEVKQDDSDAFYRLFEKMQIRLIGGTPYAKNTLGTVAAFDNAVNGTQLRKFYQEWYHPNNAVYVIAGNVDPQATIAKVREALRRSSGSGAAGTRAGYAAPAASGALSR